MAKKDPAFLFYPESFLVGVMYMTDAEVGQYIKMMCIQHQKGHIPAWIMAKQEQAVQEKFIKDEEGNYYNERLEEEITARRNYVESRRKNGAFGGRPKKGEEKSVSEWVNEIVPEELQEAFLDFVKMREEIGSPISTKGTVARLMDKVQNMSKRTHRQRMIIEQSVDNRWKNFYALPADTKTVYKETPTAIDVREPVQMPEELRKKMRSVLKGVEK